MPRWRDVAASLAVLAAAPAPAEARITPRDGQRFRLALTEERRVNGITQRFAVTRLILFHREAEGYAVEVSTEAQDRDKKGVAATMFDIGMAALVGQTIRYHVDSRGRLIGIDDEARAWTRFCDAVEAMGSGPDAPPRRRRLVEKFDSPMRTLPLANRREMLFSVLAALFEDPAATELPEERSVRVPARGVGGTYGFLDGEQRVAKAPDGTIVVETIAEGDLAPMPGPAGATPPAYLRFIASRRIDPTTGLVMERREQRETAIRGAAEPSSSTVTTSILTPLVS